MNNQIPKHLQEKKKHHYVWGNYLKSWALDGKKVWRRTESGKVDCYEISGILHQKAFYKLTDLDPDHILIVRILFSNSHPTIKKMIDQFINFSFKLQVIENTVPNEILEEGENKYILIAKSNTLENIYTDIEGNSQEILYALKNQDLSILDNDKNMMNFIIFIAHQMTRTKSMKEHCIAYINKNNPKLGSKMEECWWLIGYFLGHTFGGSIYESRKSDKHCLLINNTEEPFITSDNPVINIHSATEDNNFTPLAYDEMDIYYPISPKIGYMINNSNTFGEGKVEVTLEMVKKLNEKIAKNAYTHIVGSTEQIINTYKNNVGNWMKFIKSPN
ncbi:DUF4238 domain-containing protein [Acinetobacter baumannii]|uniref:DUF4238 domain-containing protein n=1 Tax=Acinetobacter baumannii TaxID=470 RepID=UPI000BF2ADB3|nr:DUF4238 domain-containing protein [Acinetobacter baumannii]EKX0017057.1 DUF4238 domain-containing protein [Acinetobacter baumannii]MDC4525137.1 DUF4238 domain-containing protein [Acinetobacter baumannii]MDC4730520.1 DUF4238 domain-containing protein [Acinetobacter baumannii]MDC4839720.1 DUF4238 domain-containing protein [Acinetobacter baumannii]MDC4972659.1 DUF4238 domain-containing protein [Acinetobacter baumannii]